MKRNSPILTDEMASAAVEPVMNEVRALLYRNDDPIKPVYLNRLKSWEIWLAKGCLEDERTPIFKHRPREQVVSQFTTKVKSDQAYERITSVPDYARVWEEVEASQEKNIGPMSIYRTWFQDGPDKVKAVMSDKKPLAKLKVNALQLALQDVANLLPKRSIRRTTVDDALHGWNGNPKFRLDPTTNSGYPTWVSDWHPSEVMMKGMTEADKARIEAYQLAVLKARTLITTVDKSRSYKHAIPHFVGTAGQRTVQKGPKPLESKKVKRVVIAMEKQETIAGKTIMNPLQVALASVRNATSGVRIIPAWAPMPTLDKNMQVMLEFAARHGRTVLSGDISSFDATVPPFLMAMVSDAMSEWMEPQTAELFKAIMYADIYQTCVITPSGIYPEGPSSVKSGSIFTSVIGCIINYTIQRYGHHAGYYTLDQQCVMGDDFVCDGDGVTPEAVAAAFADFGMECHPDKQFVEEGQLHFLQRTHSIGLPGGQASVYRVLGSVMSVEDDTQLKYDERNRYAYAFQALARLENANFNPEFEALVRFTALGDEEMHLGADLQPSQLVSAAGNYAKRKIEEANIKPWKSTGQGVPFEHWAVNRVLRGTQLPPLGKQRFQAVYGIGYDQVAL